MPELMDHVAFLSQEIGPRPAGTEEEQQAALYITEQLQKDAGLSAVIEDFNSASNDETPRAICCGVTFAFALASLFLPILAIPAMILTAIAGVLYALEALGRPLVSRFFARGVSQNVVAKYQPGYSPDAGGARRRKVILVARYDSGKVRPELKAPFLAALPFIQWASLISMVLVPVLLIVRNVFFLHAEGAVELVFFVLIGICLVFVALPLLATVIHKFSSYNEAANANAAGTAVLLDIARRIGRGRVSAAELAARAEAQGAVIHGEEEALAAGLVPEGAKLTYEAARMQPPEPRPQTSEDRLASAKAAIAALTGKPVPQSEPVKDIAANLVQVKDQPIGQPTDDALKEQRDETREALTSVPFDEHRIAGDIATGNGAGYAPAAGEGGSVAHEAAAMASGTGEAAVSLAASASAVTAAPSVPDWFKKAQENAKKPRESHPGEIHRSRYADAFETAAAEASSQSGQADRMVDAETEERLKKVHEEIMGPPVVSEPPADQGISEESDGIPVAEQWTSSVPSVDPAQTSEYIGAAVAVEQPREDVVVSQPASLESTTALPPIDVSDLRAQLAEEMGQMNAAAPKPAIVLPDIGKSVSSLPPIFETAKQRAPLAEAEESSQTAAKSLLTMLPTIGAEDIAAEKDGSDPHSALQGSSADKPDLTVLPSLSGEIRKPVENDDDGIQATGAVSKAGSFASAGATGVFAPVGNELIENVAPDELYIDDADDSDYGGGVTETGAFAGPGYMEMPKSRVHRFFDRFSRKKKNEEVSAHEWLDVDEEFEARSVGAARGGWESFQENEQDAPIEYQGYDDFDDVSFGDDFADGFEEEDFDDRERPWQGGAFSRRRAADQDQEEDSFEPAAASSQPIVSADDEMQQIYQFRNPDVNVEVWFVALGSELAGNAGMKAFLAEHGTELRGSVIISIDALGAGELSLIEKEGKYRRVAASSRMKRYMKKAGQATGLSSSTASIKWTESASSVALRHGFQAMSIAGMDGSKPAYFAQGDDVLENIEPDILHQNADFVMELLKNI